ncbi:MAG: hypothetical protein AAF892_09820 [Cyanobacteria bacterium P01_D01_bin.71]
MRPKIPFENQATLVSSCRLMGNRSASNSDAISHNAVVGRYAVSLSSVSNGHLPQAGIAQRNKAA